MFTALKTQFKKIRKSKSNFNMIITVIAVVMIWRWVWGILDKILFPDYPWVSYWLSIVLWIVILLIDNNKLDELSHH